jgi:hypothetical protein
METMIWCHDLGMKRQPVGAPTLALAYPPRRPLRDSRHIVHSLPSALVLDDGEGGQH